MARAQPSSPGVFATIFKMAARRALPPAVMKRGDDPSAKASILLRTFGVKYSNDETQP